MGSALPRSGALLEETIWRLWPARCCKKLNERRGLVLRVAWRLFLLSSMKTLGVIFLLLLAGCANQTARDAVRIMNRDAEKAGSPFRWKHETIRGQTIMQMTMIELPSGPSKAEGSLREAILAEIARREIAASRPAPVVADVKVMADGREVWVLESIQYGVAYVLTLGRNPEGRVVYRLEGPVAFQRKGDLPRELDLVRTVGEGKSA
jgi:hypothetical protein